MHAAKYNFDKFESKLEYVHVRLFLRPNLADPSYEHYSSIWELGVKANEAGPTKTVTFNWPNKTGIGLPYHVQSAAKTMHYSFE